MNGDVGTIIILYLVGDVYRVVGSLDQDSEEGGQSLYTAQGWATVSYLT